MQAKPLIMAVLAAFMASAAPAWGEMKCDYTTCLEWVQGKCVRYSNRCWEEGPPPPNFGAIAYGRKSQAHGKSHGWPSRGQAESVALNYCSQRGNDCEVIVWFERKCGAVAQGSQGDAVYWGLGGSGPEAGRQALAQCVKDGGKDCQVKVYHCSR